MNILQQSQLLQAGETAKTSGQLHQLQSKQQQLVAQLQVGLVIVFVDVGVFVVVVVGRLANANCKLMNTQTLTGNVSVCPARDHPGHACLQAGRRQEGGPAQAQVGINSHGDDLHIDLNLDVG